MPGRPPARLSRVLSALLTPVLVRPRPLLRPRLPARADDPFPRRAHRREAEVSFRSFRQVGRGGGLREASSAGAREQRALSRAVVWQRKASRQPPAALSHLPAAAAAAVMLLQVQPILSSDFPIVRLSSIESDSEWALIPLGRARTQRMKC